MTSGSTQGRGVALMMASSVVACLGQLMWKISGTAGWWAIGVGFVLYGAGALMMLIAYQFGELSVLQPILGLSYVLSRVFGALWLSESLTWGRVVGMVAVLAGVVLIAGKQRRVESPQPS